MAREGGGPALEPGQWVRHPAHADWGVGQVQSAIGPRVTVTFENAGKVLIQADRVALVIEDRPG
jgi:hypothetical protein